MFKLLLGIIFFTITLNFPPFALAMIIFWIVTA